DRLDCIVRAAQQVGRPIFASLAIIVLSFTPVFMLTGQEGKLFKPLAYTKTFSMAAAAILSITLVPVLMTFFLTGRVVEEEKNPISRFFVRLYRPVLATALRFKWGVVGLAILAMAAAVPVARSIGSEFMPPLDEGSLLYMPTMLPDVGITEAARLLQTQDRILKGFPEVASVLGKVGRADTATDPAPISMTETIVTLRPHSRWPAGETKEQLIAKLDSALQIPGVVNAWTQPIINRINMLTTGVRTDLGLKIYGPALPTLERLSLRAERILEAVPGAADVYADRITTGRFLDITPDRQALARYGMTVGDLQEVISVAIGGQTLTRVVDGRERFPVVLRYGLDF
ncbi:MAG: efflux RND transporter permease subunit, partial [Cyanobacteria bacterium REEB65]|nr:efflux RND transporter permease subunit [Cyanobacteria bacterium REEB65]